MRFVWGYDLGITACGFLLLCAGFIVLSSIDPVFFKNQLLFSTFGVATYLAFSTVQVSVFKKAGPLFYFAALVLLALLLFIGVDVRGARRWVDIFAIRIQFSELLKPFLIVSFASLLSLWYGKIRFREMLIIVALFIPILFFLIRQPDLGSAIVYSASFAFMFFLAGLSIWYIAIGIGIGLALLPLIFRFLADYQKNRIISFFNPTYDPLGIGYNALQSTIAVGSGLLLGRGLGRGVQSQLAFLPERHTDFIFATLSEEFGFVGSFAVLALYFLLLLRLLHIARNCESRFEYFILVGVFAVILSQVFINIGMNIGLIPITGVTLPLISYGGSSLVTTAILLGLANSISRRLKTKQDVLEIR